MSFDEFVWLLLLLLPPTVWGGIRRRDQRLVGHDGWGRGAYVQYVVYLTSLLLYDERCFTGSFCHFCSPLFPRCWFSRVPKLTPDHASPIILADLFVLLGLQYVDLSGSMLPFVAAIPFSCIYYARPTRHVGAKRGFSHQCETRIRIAQSRMRDC
jgi:hypothetical protein